jgi:DNA-binding response OmpR family regulator
VISGRSSEEDKVRALDLGADDYLVKPFGVKEFEARVRALLRRGIWAGATQIEYGGLCLDPAAHTVTLNGRPLPLSARETAVLELLMRDFGKVVSKERLHSHVYSYDEEAGENAIEVFIHRLRKKLLAAPVTVRTFHGVGYQLDHRDAAGGANA